MYILPTVHNILCFCILQVLIVGGGDGGAAREVLKHKNIESVTLCEIDEVTCQFIYYRREGIRKGRGIQLCRSIGVVLMFGIFARISN